MMMKNVNFCGENENVDSEGHCTCKNGKFCDEIHPSHFNIDLFTFYALFVFTIILFIYFITSRDNYFNKKITEIKSVNKKKKGSPAKEGDGNKGNPSSISGHIGLMVGEEDGDDIDGGGDSDGESHGFMQVAEHYKNSNTPHSNTIGDIHNRKHLSPLHHESHAYKKNF